MRHASLLVIGLLLVACKGKDEGEDSATTDTPKAEGELQYAPIVQWDSTYIDGNRAYYYVPPDPVAMVWAFHGSGMNSGYCSLQETIAVLNELIVEGFGFACAESTDRDTGTWDQFTAPEANPDIDMLGRLEDQLVQTTDLKRTTPVYALGFSGGGAMSTFFIDASLSAGRDARASAPHMSSGSPWGRDYIPIIWVIAENDPQPEAEEAILDRLDAGAPTEVYHTLERAIDETWFTKNPNVSLEQSTEAFQEAIAFGLIDDGGARIIPIEQVDGWLGQWVQSTEINAPEARAEELRVAWALHRMSGEYAREVRDFFLDFL